jgi:hypothetical protein
MMFELMFVLVLASTPIYSYSDITDSLDWSLYISTNGFYSIWGELARGDS